MTEVFALDAWALMAFFQKEEPAAARVRALLVAAQSGRAQLYISIINVGEVYYRLGKVNGRGIAEEALNNLRLLPITICPAEDEFVLAAARWKMSERMSYADAFAAALAEQENATLLTGDPELLALQGKLTLEALTRS